MFWPNLFSFIAKIDEDKRVIIGPANFNTSPMKKGREDRALFEKPDYTAVGKLDKSTPLKS